MPIIGRDGEREFTDEEHQFIDKLSTIIQLLFMNFRAPLSVCVATLSELLMAGIYEMSKPKNKEEAEKFFNEFIEVGFKPSVKIFIDGMYDKKEPIFKREFH